MISSILLIKFFQYTIVKRLKLKETDRLCKVVEQSMQCCGQILQDSFETYKTFKRSVNPEFERKVDVQNRTFEWIQFSGIKIEKKTFEEFVEICE